MAEERVGTKGVRKKPGSKVEGKTGRGNGTSTEFEEILEAAREHLKGEGAVEGVGARGDILEQGTTEVQAQGLWGTRIVAAGRGVGSKTGMVMLANRYERIRVTRGMIAAGIAWEMWGWGAMASDLFLGRVCLAIVIQLLRVRCITKFLCKRTTVGRVDRYSGSTVRNMNWCRGRNKLGKRGVERGIT